MRTRYCQKAEQTQLWWYSSTGHVSRTRGTTLHEIRHRDLSEMSSRSAELPTLQTLMRCHCSFYLSFYYIKASVGKASPSIIVLLCCHAATAQEPAHFGGVLWAQQFFGTEAILLDRLARERVVLPPPTALLLSLQVSKHNQEHLNDSKMPG